MPFLVSLFTQNIFCHTNWLYSPFLQSGRAQTPLKAHLALDGEGMVPILTADDLPQHNKRLVLPLLPVGPHPEMKQTNYVNDLVEMLQQRVDI